MSKYSKRHTRGRMHQFEWNIGDQFATQSTAVQLYSDRIRDYDTQSIRVEDAKFTSSS